MNIIKKCIVLTFLLLVGSISAQQKLEKPTQKMAANSDVVIDLNTSYANVVIEKWDRNEVQVDAFVESDKLSNEELKEALDDWKVELTGDKSNLKLNVGGTFHYRWSANLAAEEAMEALKDLKIELADMPEMPEMPEFPEMPEMPELNFEIADIPEMPELPELPELPDGVHSVNFDNKAYQKEGEAYLERWSKEYEEKYGKEFKEKMKDWAREFSKLDFDKYSIKMEAWGEEFGEKFGKKFDEKFSKDMEKWGEEIAKKFDGEWAKKMEAWGEEFGEKFGKEFDERMAKRESELKERLQEREERMQEREENMQKRLEDRERRMEDRREEIEQRLEEREARRAASYNRWSERRSDKIKRTIIIKIPNDANLKVDIRHGELKFSSVIYNLDANLNHASLHAEGIDGSKTSINASYSPVFVNTWKEGNLEINYVEDAKLNNATNLTLDANSSNITIDRLHKNAIINGSFGDLAINTIQDDFNNLNIILENSDAFVKLPDSDYQLIFKGNRSKLNNERTDSKTVKNGSSSKTIMVNAKFSNVIMQ